MNKFVVIHEKQKLENPEKYLSDNRYFKAHILCLAQKNNINISDTTVIATPSSLELLDDIAQHFSWPIMIRMDYSHMKDGKKFIGGVPIESVDALRKVCMFLFDNECIPILQPYFNRFKNQYNINADVSNINSKDYSQFDNMEIVGEGFDAGDLRLGRCRPHETIRFDFDYWEIISRNIISDDDYFLSKQNREHYIGKMSAYFKHVNETGKLLYNLDSMKSIKENNYLNNLKYVPMRKTLVKDVADMIYEIHEKLLPRLSDRNNIIASISKLENDDLIFWDMYGPWYYR